MVIVHSIFERRHDCALERVRRVRIEVGVDAVQNARQANTTSNQLLLDYREILVKVVIGQVGQILIRSIFFLQNNNED